MSTVTTARVDPTDDDVKGKGKGQVLDIALLHDEHQSVLTRIVDTVFRDRGSAAAGDGDCIVHRL